MKTHSKLLPALLLLILVVPQVDADEPPENGPNVKYYENDQKAWENHYKNGKEISRKEFFRRRQSFGVAN